MKRDDLPSVRALRKEFPGQVVFRITVADPVDGEISVSGACDSSVAEKAGPPGKAFTALAMRAWAALK